MTTHDTVTLLGRSEVASRLGISKMTLDRIVKAGALPVVRIDSRPRFLPEDVAEFVRSRRDVSTTGAEGDE